MGLGHSPRIVTDGMVLCLDAANPRNFNLTGVEVLVVAGGGGGGRHSGGGGGGGGLIYNSNFAVTPGTQLTVTVGNGGASLYGTYPTQDGGNGINGGSSVFGSLEAIGGGGGGYYNSGGNVGGSGGGAGRNNTGANGTAGQGNAGGSGAAGGFQSPNYPAHGGGGAGGSGKIGSQSKGGDGGIGLLFNINGTPTYYAGGGGGNIQYTSALGGVGGLGGGGAGSSGFEGLPALYGTDGTPNTGGGGGGTHYDAPATGTSGIEGRGGSGIVIVRYQGPQKAIGGTVTSVGGDTIHTFTTSGNFTPLVNTNGSAVLGLSDLSGNRNFGTTANSPTYSTANGGSLSFDGSDDYVTIPGGGSLNISNTLTAMVWVYYISGNGRIFQKDGPPYTRCWEIGGYGGQFRMEMWHSNGTGTIGYGNSLAVNGWTHLALTFDGTDIKMYQNSSLVSTVNFPGDIRTDANTPIILGGYWDGEYLNGRVSGSQIYNRALSAAEIQQNYNALKGRFSI